MERMDGGSEDGATGYLIDAPKDAALEGRKIAMRGNTYRASIVGIFCIQPTILVLSTRLDIDQYKLLRSNVSGWAATF